MNNQAAQTMPALPRPYWKAGDVRDDYGNPYNETDLFTDDDMRAMYQQGYAAALSQTAGMVEPLPMDTAPRDGTMVRLLVNFTDHATEDTAGPAWTIGAYPSDNESGGWQFAGWCWTHDHFTEGEGTPIGWLPMLASAPAASGVHPDALPDGTLSKSTAKRVTELAASGGEYPECSGDPASCPENEGHGCCKPNPARHFAIVCDWRGADPFPTFIEAEVGGKSISLEWRDRPDGLKELIVPVTAEPNPPSAASVSERARDDLHVAICQAVALMNMEPMTTPGLLQAHDILRKAIS